jgi:hypothetical protein
MFSVTIPDKNGNTENDITIERYDRDIHGYCDDCDYVISVPSLELADGIADRMGYSGCINRFSDNGYRIFVLMSRMVVAHSG